VDDDPGVRHICRIVLELAGYEVIEADSPHTAMELWKIHAQDIDLLVTDYDMPELTGLELLTFLRVSKPNLKVLLISGKCQEPIPASVMFLQKPFTPRILTETVRRCF
jgi:DNA-binding NtrC family response regulator